MSVASGSTDRIPAVYGVNKWGGTSFRWPNTEFITLETLGCIFDPLSSVYSWRLGYLCVQCRQSAGNSATTARTSTAGRTETLTDDQKFPRDSVDLCGQFALYAHVIQGFLKGWLPSLVKRGTFRLVHCKFQAESAKYRPKLHCTKYGVRLFSKLHV